MNRKWYLLILMFLMSMLSVTTFAQKCNRCNGHGQINKSVSTAGYGLAKKIGDCNVCGHMIFSGEPHNHVPCPSCGGSGKNESTTSPSRTDSSSKNNTSGILYPSEEDEIQGILRTLREGMTETRRCQTCNGTNRCPGTGRHHYGNMAADMLYASITPVYCHLCDGWGDCPNKNCMKGTEFYTRPCTESEKARLNERIDQIYQYARERENGYSGVYTGGTSVSQSNTSNTTNSSVPTTYQVTIKAYNSSDEIYVNGKYYTRGAYTGQFYPGNHTIECRNTGRYSSSKSIYVSGSMTVTMPELRQMPSLKINAGNDISIYLDGKYITSLSSTTQYVDYGSHKVEFKKEKYHTVTKTININSLSGNTITVNSLDPIVGSMNITSTPVGMTVKLDGEEKGITPLIIKDVIIGNHKVELSGENYYTETYEAEIQDSKQTSLDFKMKPFAKVSFSSNRYNSNVYIDGKYVGNTPSEVNLGFGRYMIEVSKPYHKSRRKSITVNNTSNQYHRFKLPLQCQQYSQGYIQPTYQFKPYEAAGLIAGFSIGYFNMEGHFMYGLEHPDDMVWIPSDPNDNSLTYKYSYTPFCYGGKLGVSCIAGTRFRFTPQLGVNVNTFKGKGDNGKSTASAIGLTGGLKIDFAFNSWLGISISPEYNYTIKKNSVYNTLNKASDSFGKMTDGFVLRLGLQFFCGEEY